MPSPGLAIALLVIAVILLIMWTMRDEWPE